MFEQEYTALEERLAEMSELKNEYDGCTQLLEYNDTHSTKTRLHSKLVVGLSFMDVEGISQEHVKEIIRMIENKVSEIRMNDASKLRDYLN
jgi:hypothetical protein